MCWKDLHGLGPEDAYTGGGRLGSAQRGVIGENVWAVGPTGPRNCDEFKDTTRPRYAQLQALLKANDGAKPRVQLAAANVSKIEPIEAGTDTGRLRVTFKGSAINPNVTTTTARQNLTYTRVVDRVVLGTGYEKDDGSAYVGVLGRANKDFRAKLEDVRGKPASFQEEVVIARRFADAPDVVFVGPAAGKLPDDKELAGIQENSVGLFANTPRTEALAQQLAATDLQKPKPPRFMIAEQEPAFLQAGSGSVTIDVPKALDGRAVRGDNALAVKSAIIAAIGNIPTGTLDLTIRAPEEGKLEFTSPLVDAESVGRLSQALAAEVGLLERLIVMTRGKRVLKISAPADRDGKIRANELQVQTPVKVRVAKK